MTPVWGAPGRSLVLGPGLGVPLGVALGRGEGVPLGREVALGLGVTAVGLGVGSTDGDAGAVWAGTAVWPVPGSRFTIPTPARATTATVAADARATRRRRTARPRDRTAAPRASGSGPEAGSANHSSSRSSFSSMGVMTGSSWPARPLRENGGGRAHANRWT